MHLVASTFSVAESPRELAELWFPISSVVWCERERWEGRVASDGWVKRAEVGLQLGEQKAVPGFWQGMFQTKSWRWQVNFLIWVLERDLDAYGQYVDSLRQNVKPSKIKNLSPQIVYLRTETRKNWHT